MHDSYKVIATEVSDRAHRKPIERLSASFRFWSLRRFDVCFDPRTQHIRRANLSPNEVDIVQTRIQRYDEILRRLQDRRTDNDGQIRRGRLFGNLWIWIHFAVHFDRGLSLGSSFVRYHHSTKFEYSLRRSAVRLQTVFFFVQ